MKLLVSLTLLSAVCAAVGALVCRHCTDPNDPECTLVENIICPWGKMCVTASVIVESTDHPVMRIFKDCVGRSVCSSPGERVISSNVGDKFSLANVNCCNTRKCNGEVLPFPDVSEHMLNRRFCPGCDSSESMCTDTVECRGNEATCFAATVLNAGVESTVYGCGSDDVCAASEKLDSLPFLEELGTVSATPTCTDAPEPQIRRCLQCDDPMDTTCAASTETDCEAGTDLCFTFTEEGGRIYRGCGPPSVCPSPGSFLLSADIGSSLGLANAECCRGDGCNTATLAAPTQGMTNGLMCHICIPGSTVCNFLVLCEGEENRCLTSASDVGGNSLPLLGCTTEAVCNAPDTLVSVLLPGTVLTEPVSCCSSMRCNDPDRVITTTLPPSTTTGMGGGSGGLGGIPPFLFPGVIDADLNAVVIQEMLFVVQQVLLYLQQLQLYLLQCPVDQQLLLQPLLLLCQQLLIYVQLLLQPQGVW